MVAKFRIGNTRIAWENYGGYRRRVAIAAVHSVDEQGGSRFEFDVREYDAETTAGVQARAQVFCEMLARAATKNDEMVLRAWGAY